MIEHRMRSGYMKQLMKSKCIMEIHKRSRWKEYDNEKNKDNIEIKPGMIVQIKNTNENDIRYFSKIRKKSSTKMGGPIGIVISVSEHKCRIKILIKHSDKSDGIYFNKKYDGQALSYVINLSAYGWTPKIWVDISNIERYLVRKLPNNNLCAYVDNVYMKYATLKSENFNIYDDEYKNFCNEYTRWVYSSIKNKQ